MRPQAASRRRPLRRAGRDHRQRCIGAHACLDPARIPSPPPRSVSVAAVNSECTLPLSRLLRSVTSLLLLPCPVVTSLPKRNERSFHPPISALAQRERAVHLRRYGPLGSRSRTVLHSLASTGLDRDAWQPDWRASHCPPDSLPPLSTRSLRSTVRRPHASVGHSCARFSSPSEWREAEEAPDAESRARRAWR